MQPGMMQALVVAAAVGLHTPEEGVVPGVAELASHQATEVIMHLLVQEVRQSSRQHMLKVGD
jgi:hypothetical protein